MIGQLWGHWSVSEWAKAKLPIFIFMDAQDQDLGLSCSLAQCAGHWPLITQIRILSTSAKSNNQASNDKPNDDIEKSKITVIHGILDSARECGPQ